MLLCVEKTEKSFVFSTTDAKGYIKALFQRTYASPKSVSFVLAQSDTHRPTPLLTIKNIYAKI